MEATEADAGGGTLPSRASTGVAEIHEAFETGAVGGLSDGQLLGRFVDRRDEAAVAALVGRHGPMVRGVCRRILGDPHDADDAFQATFLVLARRAASVVPPDRVGPWLHGVALRTARKARALRARRLAREAPAARLPEPAASAFEPDERLARLDAELDRLPAKYRLPIVLCDLQGRTHREAADDLGWPVGTVAGRLARGRALLAGRLARPGSAPSGRTLGAPLVAAYSDRIPPALLDLTARGVARFAAGRFRPAGMFSAQTLALAEGVDMSMRIMGLKWVAVALAAAAAIGAGSGWLRRPHRDARAAASMPVDDATDIQGIWTGIVAEVGGKNWFPGRDMPPPTVQLNVEGDRIALRGPIYGDVVVFVPREDAKFIYRADASKSPARLDLTVLPEADDITPRIHPGIYRRDGDDLLVCLSLPNKKRPAGFATEPKTAQMLLRLRTAIQEERSEQDMGSIDPVTLLRPGRSAEVEPALAKLVVGKLVRAAEVSKDQMILSYLPDWAFGRVDNIAIANNDGGVRTLLDWSANVVDAAASDRRFVLALYARKTTGDARGATIVATEVESDWSEQASWRDQPKYATDPAAAYPFEPGDGWKLLDVTDLMRRRMREGRSGRGIVLRFQDEDRPGGGNGWSGYQMVSREGAGEWKSKRPKLLVVEPAPK